MKLILITRNINQWQLLGYIISFWLLAFQLFKLQSSVSWNSNTNLFSQLHRTKITNNSDSNSYANVCFPGQVFRPTRSVFSLPMTSTDAAKTVPNSNLTATLSPSSNIYTHAHSHTGESGVCSTETIPPSEDGGWFVVLAPPPIFIVGELGVN